MGIRGIGIICLLCLIIGNQTFGQSATTIADGPWNAGSTWSTGSPPTSSNAAITISHAVYVPAGYSVTIDQTSITAAGSLEIQAGGTVTVAAGTGNDLTVNGVMDVYGTLVNNHQAVIAGTDGTDLRFYDGSVLSWLNNTIAPPPLATWSANSTLEITGFSGGSKTLTSTNWTQNYGNIIWNTPGITGAYNLSGLITSIQGDLSVIETNGRPVRLTNTESATITIQGDLNILNAAELVMTASGIVTVNIGGDLNHSSTSGDGSYSATTGIATINLTGDFNMNAVGGEFHGGSGGGSGNTTINVGGDFLVYAGTFDETGSAALVNLNFNNGTVHTFVNNGTIRNDVNYYIGANDVLDVGTSPVNGAIFNLSGTLRVGSTDALGAIRASTTGGNIRTTIASRVYNSGSTIEYNGAAAQFMGNGHPNTTGVTTIINNAAGVSLASNVAINGNLVLTLGNLNVDSNAGARALTLGANVVPGSNYITFSGTQSDLTINGSGLFGTFPFPPGAQSFRNFTLNRSGGSVTFAQPVTITGSVSLPAGELIFHGQTLTLNGTFASTGGSLSSDNASTLTIGGSGGFGTFVFSNTGNVLNTLNFNRVTGGATLSGTLTITTALNLNNGNLTNGGGLTLSNGATITRASTSALLSNRPINGPGETWNVTYTGVNTTTGLELPLPTNDDLGNLTINGGIINLVQSMIVMGNVNLNANTLNGNTHTITMRGAQWNDNDGTFNPGSGIVLFAGTTTIGGTSEPTFGNLQTASGAVVTFPAGNLNIARNITFDAGSTINPNGGTVVLNGTILQTIAGAGKTLNNLTINKSGGTDAALNSALSLTGVLNVASASSNFASGGLLTLLSTSDGATGNASVAALLNGATVSGNVNVQRYMSMEGRIYRYISSPVTNAPVSQIQPEIPVTGTFTGASTCTNCLTNPSLFYYDASTNTYIPYPTSSNAQTLAPGRGYSIFVRQDILPGPVTMDVTGPINQGTINLPIAYATGDSATWNLVGNPYPSTIDWDSPTGWSKAVGISPWIAVRDNGAGGIFHYWDGAEGSLGSGRIAAGQGFWVATTVGGATLSVNEEAKTSNTGVFYRKETPDAIMVHVTKGNLWDKVYVRLRDKARSGHDVYDVPKLSNDYFNFASLTTDGDLVAINAMKQIDCGNRIPLYMDFAKRSNGTYLINPQGSYTLALERKGLMQGYNVSIHDNFTGMDKVLNENESFTFTITSDEKSIASDRFSLSFSEIATTSNVVVNADAMVCENLAGKVTLENTQAGMRYQVLKNNEVIAEKTGENATVEFIVEPSLLGDAENTFMVKQVGLCGTATNLSSVTITKSSVASPVTVMDTVCNAGSATLKAIGTNAASYFWYEGENATQAIAGQYTDQFVTPSLSKSKSYFVSAVDASGCISPRAEVLARVIVTPEITIAMQGNKLQSSLPEGNEWYLDGNKIENANTATIMPMISGLYTVKNNSCGCWVTAQYEVTMEEDKFAKEINVYPNPSSDVVKFFIKRKLNVTEPSLWDLNGKKIGDFVLENDGISTKGELNMTYLRPGVYIAKFNVDSRQVIVKIVKN